MAASLLYPHIRLASYGLPLRCRAAAARPRAWCSARSSPQRRPRRLGSAAPGTVRQRGRALHAAGCRGPSASLLPDWSCRGSVAAGCSVALQSGSVALGGGAARAAGKASRLSSAPTALWGRDPGHPAGRALHEAQHARHSQHGPPAYLGVAITGGSRGGGFRGGGRRRRPCCDERVELALPPQQPAELAHPCIAVPLVKGIPAAQRLKGA